MSLPSTPGAPQNSTGQAPSTGTADSPADGFPVLPPPPANMQSMSAGGGVTIAPADSSSARDRANAHFASLADFTEALSAIPDRVPTAVLYATPLPPSAAVIRASQGMIEAQSKA